MSQALIGAKPPKDFSLARLVDYVTSRSGLLDEVRYSLSRPLSPPQNNFVLDGSGVGVQSIKAFLKPSYDVNEIRVPFERTKRIDYP